MEQEFEEAIYLGGDPSLNSSYDFPRDRADTPWTFLYDPRLRPPHLTGNAPVLYDITYK